MALVDKNNVSSAQKVIIVLFAVILVLSLMLPFFTTCSAPTPTQVDIEDAQDNETEIDEEQVAASVADVETRYAQVVAARQEALENDKDDYSALVSLARVRLEIADEIASLEGVSDQDIENAYTNAREYLDRCLELKPADEAVRLLRARALRALDDTQGAADDLELLVTANPDNSYAWYELGQLRYSQGEYEASAEAFRQAIESDADGSDGVLANAQLMAAIVESVISTQTNEDDGEAQDNETTADSEVSQSAESTDEPNDE